MPETYYDKQIEWPGAAVFALAGWPGFVSVSVPLCVSMCMFMRKGIVVSLSRCSFFDHSPRIPHRILPGDHPLLCRPREMG